MTNNNNESKDLCSEWHENYDAINFSTVETFFIEVYMASDRSKLMFKFDEKHRCLHACRAKKWSLYHRSTKYFTPAIEDKDLNLLNLLIDDNPFRYFIYMHYSSVPFILPLYEKQYPREEQIEQRSDAFLHTLNKIAELLDNIVDVMSLKPSFYDLQTIFRNYFSEHEMSIDEDGLPLKRSNRMRTPENIFYGGNTREDMKRVSYELANEFLMGPTYVPDCIRNLVVTTIGEDYRDKLKQKKKDEKKIIKKKNYQPRKSKTEMQFEKDVRSSKKMADFFK